MIVYLSYYLHLAVSSSKRDRLRCVRPKKRKTFKGCTSASWTNWPNFLEWQSRFYASVLQRPK